MRRVLERLCARGERGRVRVIERLRGRDETYRENRHHRSDSGCKQRALLDGIRLPRPRPFRAAQRNPTRRWREGLACGRELTGSNHATFKKNLGGAVAQPTETAAMRSSLAHARRAETWPAGAGTWTSSMFGSACASARRRLPMRPAAPLIASLAGAIVLPCCWAEKGRKGRSVLALWAPQVDLIPKVNARSYFSKSTSSK